MVVLAVLAVAYAAVGASYAASGAKWLRPLDGDMPWAARASFLATVAVGWPVIARPSTANMEYARSRWGDGGRG